MISPDQPRCCFCNKYVAVTFYCFGYKNFICYDCEYFDSEPPSGHTKPTQHYLTNPRKKVRAMSKTTELARVNQELAAARDHTAWWQKRFNDLCTLHSNDAKKHTEELRTLRNTHAAQLMELTDKAITNLEKARLATERDTFGRALKYLADNLTTYKPE